MTTLTAHASAPSSDAPRRWTVDAFFTPISRALALGVMGTSFIFPVGGLGVDLCVFHATTGLPCPGCGISRAISAISQGDFSAAAGLNPFAFIAWPTFLFIAALTFVPKATRERLQARASASILAGRIYLITFWAFLGFGLARLATFIWLGERFP